MKRHIARLIILLLCSVTLLAARPGYGGLSSIAEGSYSYFTDADCQVYSDGGLALPVGAYERVDLEGTEEDVTAIIETAGAVIKKRERIGEIEIIYAYTDALSATAETGFGTVNLMIAVSGSRIAVGSPLLKGSY